MGIIELVDVQVMCGIEKEEAVVFAAYQRLGDRKRERLLPTDRLCGAVAQTGDRARAGQEGFVAQAHGVKARRTGQSREGFGVTEEALSTTLWHIEAKNTIGPTGPPEHQRDAAKHKIHGRNSRSGQLLERHELLAQVQVITGTVKIVDRTFLGGHDYTISLRVDNYFLGMALDHGGQVISLVNRRFACPE